MNPRLSQVGLVIMAAIAFGFTATVADVQSGTPIIVSSQENTGLTIITATGNITPNNASGFRCLVRNDSTKEVVSYAVLWTITFASGKSSTHSQIQDGSLIPSAHRIVPGETSENVSTGGVLTPVSNPITKLEVSTDFVLFADGTSAGKDLAGSRAQMQQRQLGARIIRNHLQEIYQTKGLDALIEELNAKGLTMK